MARSSDVVVVGGGILGVCSAYFLARGGASVTLLEARDPGAGASGASFAWINATSKEPRYYHDLNRQGIVAYERLSQAMCGTTSCSTPQPPSPSEHLGLHRGGSLRLAVTTDEQAMLHNRFEELRAWEYPVAWLDRRGILDLEPDLALPGEEMAAMYAELDLRLDPPRFLSALLTAARHAGARILPHTPVTGLQRDGNRVMGVATATDEHVAGTVLLAAGTRVPELAASAGVSVPVERVPGLLALTTPAAGGGPRRVFHAPGIHARPTLDGRFLLGATDVDNLIDEDTPAELLPASAAVLSERLARWYPALSAAQIESARVCVRPMPADGFPIVGPAAGIIGLYLAATHSGITLGALLGESIAHELLTGDPLPLLAAYRPERFTPHQGGFSLPFREADSRSKSDQR